MKSRLETVLTQFPSLLAAATAVAIGVACTASANNALWIGNPGVTTTTNWSDNANWNNVGGGGAGPNGNDVVFGDGGAVGTAGTINSVVDNSSLNPFSLTFTNESQSPNLKFHTVLIPAGVGMTNANGLTVGINSAVNGYLTTVNFVGGGTFAQNGANLTVKDIGSAASTGARATLDLSGLSNFVYSASGGTLNVAGSGSDARGGGTLTLAATNNITVGTISVTTGNGNVGAGGILNLGLGANIINVGTINICIGKVNTSTVKFLGATGSLKLRGVGGTDADRANFLFANRNAGGTGALNGTLDLTGHPVDIKAGTITLGQGTSNPTGTTTPQNGTATLIFDTGTIDATNINMAVNSQSLAATFGNLTVGGGTLVVSNISLVNQTAGAGTGNLYIGGAVNASGNIFKTTLAGTGNITITNGTLTQALGKTVGTPAIPIDNLNLTTATLNLPVANNSTNMNVSALNLVDSANTVNITALPILSGYPSQFPIFSYTSFPGGGSVNLGTLPSTYTGYLSNDTVSVIWLVVTNGPSTSKADEWGGGVNNLWDKTSFNWTNSATAVTYAEGDSVTFDDLAQTGNVSLTAGRGPLNLTVTNNTLNYTFSGSGSITGAVALVKQGTASLTLTETGGDNFSGGITVGAGTVILDDTNCLITGGVIISSGATLQVGVNDVNGALPGGSVQDDGALIFSRTNNVIVSVPINGAGSLTSTGKNGTLTLSSTNGYTGITFVGNSKLVLSGSGAITNSAQVIFSNATFDMSAASGQTVLNSLNLTNSTIIAGTTNLQPPISAGSLNLGGSGNTINVSALPIIASYPTTITLIQSAGPISGFNMSLGTLPSASPPYAGSVALSGDSTAVLLTLTAGPVGVRPNVTWSGVDALGSVNTNWSDRLNWQLPGVPGAGDNVIFNNTAAQSASSLSTPGGGSTALIPENINNIVDANFTIASLTFTNTGGTYHNTQITNGATLTVTNIFTVGVIDSASTAQQEYVNFSGTRATLSVNNTNSNLQVWVGDSGTATAQATLDLSALDNFTANISRLTVGASAANNAINRPGGILYLAKTNTINCAFQTTTVETGTTTGNSGIVLGDCNQNNGPSGFIYLGQANIISADTIGIARQKTTGTLLFNPIYANVAPYPSVTFKGFSSGLISIFSVGDGVGNTGSTTGTGDLNLDGGFVTATVDTLNIGRASSGGTGANITTGKMEFDAGTISVNTLNIGLQPVAAGTKVGNGTVSVSSNSVIGVATTLTVRSNLNLGTNLGGTGAASTAGTLNITNATVLANNIVAGANGATSTINLSGGTLAVTNAAGTPAAPITTLNLDGGILQLKADGAATVAVLVATTINTNNATIIKLGSVVNVTSTTNIPLISYTGTDPYGSLTLVTSPGYAASLVDNTGNSTIDLSITATVNTSPTNINATVSGNVLTLSWPADHTGWRLQVQTNSLSAGLNTNWFDVLGSTSVNSVNVTMDPTKGTVFYRMVYP